MVNNRGFKVVTEKIFLKNSYLYEQRKYNEHSNPKYSTVVIIPREKIETIKAVKNAIEQAKKQGQEIFNNKSFGETSFSQPLKKGNDSSSLDIIYKDAYYLNASTYYQPEVVDENRNPLPKHFVVNGVVARVSLLFQPYSNNGKEGVACVLLNIQLFKEQFDPSKYLPKAEDDFL